VSETKSPAEGTRHDASATHEASSVSARRLASQPFALRTTIMSMPAAPKALRIAKAVMS
jgi:hypothetical protein